MLEDFLNALLPTAELDEATNGDRVEWVRLLGDSCLLCVAMPKPSWTSLRSAPAPDPGFCRQSAMQPRRANILAQESLYPALQTESTRFSTAGPLQAPDLQPPSFLLSVKSPTFREVASPPESPDASCNCMEQKKLCFHLENVHQPPRVGLARISLWKLPVGERLKCSQKGWLTHYHTKALHRFVREH